MTTPGRAIDLRKGQTAGSQPEAYRGDEAEPPLRDTVAAKKIAGSAKNGAPERIRTSDPQIRSLVLYPAELRARLEGAT